MSALFGGAQARSKNLVEFKAGKMSLKGKMVHPDKRKGLVYVYQSDDSLMHFCWKDRTNGLVEDDLMIFPDDVEIKRVTQCTTGRVFLMRFKSSNKKFFFWMQETDTEKDEKLWKKVNDMLNNPGSSAAAASSSSLASAGAGGAGTNGGERGVSSSSGGLPSIADFGGLEGAANTADFHSLIGSMSDQQLQMFLGGLMPGMMNTPTATAAAAAAAATSSTATSRSSAASSASTLSTSNQASRVQSSTGAASRVEPVSAAATQAALAEPGKEVTNGATGASTESSAGGTKTMQFADFQNILGNLAAQQSGTGRGATDLDLSEVLTLDMMAPILGNREVQARLVEHLPESPDILLAKNEHELRQTLTTPQFKKAMSSFCMALQSGQLGPVFKQFGLPDEVANAAAQGNLEAFAKAMEAHAKEKKTTETKKAQDEDAMDTK